MAQRLKTTCAALADYRVPYSLEHGDFHDRQIIMTDTGPMYYDWSDCSVSHPFFSLHLFFAFQDFENCLPDIPDVQARLRDAYLAPWTVYESMERLRAAFELAQHITPVHTALLYHRIILPGMEQRWEMHYMIPWFLKSLVRNPIS